MKARLALVQDESMRRTTRVIDPRRSKYLPIWDGVAAVALVFTAIVLPFEISFVVDASPVYFVLNRLVDVIFCVDIGLQFFVAYPASRTFTGAGSHWVTDHQQIIRHYLGGWFALDAVSTLVAVFDVISFASGDSSLQRLQILRVLRVLRLSKLLRLLRGVRIFRRFELRWGIDYGRLALVQSMVTLMVVAHWSACAWALQTTFQSQLEGTWLVDRGYCVVLGAAEGEWRPPHDHPPPLESAYSCVAPTRVYMACLYFAVMSITSIGYGDISATPLNASEQLVAILIMVVGGVAWASFVGHFFSYITTMDPGTTAFRLSMRALNSYAESNGLPADLRVRLRDFFHRTKHLEQSRSTAECLLKLSPALQGEVLLNVNARWIRAVSWLKDEHPFFIAELVMAAHPEVFTPGEVCTQPVALHIVHSGSAVYGGRILSKGGVWGDDVIVAASHLRCRHYARATTYLEAFYVTRDAIFECAQAFEETHCRLRRAARLIALRRYVVLVSKVSRTAQLVSSKAAEPRQSRASRMWKRSLTKSNIAREVQHEITDTACPSFKKADADLSFEERFRRSREQELVRALFLVSEDVQLGIDAEKKAGLRPKRPRRTQDVSEKVEGLTAAIGVMRGELREALSRRPAAVVRQRSRPSRALNPSVQAPAPECSPAGTVPSAALSRGLASEVDA